jgi:hypothetical protein
MARYEVRFLKDICNDTGHPRCVVQHIVRLEAADTTRAHDEACAVFCGHEKIGHWRDHADRIEIVETDAAARRS